MSERTSDPLNRLDLDLAHRIDAVCCRFEADRRAGKRPAIGDYLDEVPEPGRPALRIELEAIERELCGTDGNAASPPPSTEDATAASRDDVPVAPELPRLRHFGDYEIIREVARGGMGIVFLARQKSLNRSVALKMILAGQLADETDVRRFHTEAEAAANLDHPGIVPIHEVGQHEGQHYFSMGFVEGPSLAQRLTAGPLPPREAADLMAKVSEAIDYAHRHGLIHRDLKPGNIVLDRSGNPRVTDFGLARKLEADSDLTGSGQIMGTPSYMPPEQARNDRGEVGPPADVYAMGATLYALVTGRPPFQAATAVDTLLMVVGDEPVPPRRLNASLPLDLETICLKCLEKEPGKRYAGASALNDDLRRYLAGRPIQARPVGPAERVWRWSRRNRELALFSALAAMLAVLLVIGSAASAWVFRRQRDAVAAEQRKTEVNLGRALAAERRREAELGRSLRLQARDLRLSGRPGRRIEGLRILADAAKLARDGDAPPEHLAELRDEVIATLALDDIRPVQTRSTPDPPSKRSALAVEADRYVVVGNDGTLRLHRLSDRSVIAAVGADRPATRDWPIFAPGGRFLSVWAGPSRIELWDLERGEIPAAWPADARYVAHRADGAQVAVLRADGELRVYDLPAMSESARFQTELDLPAQVANFWMVLSGDGRRAAILPEQSASARVYEVPSGRLVCEVRVPTARVFASLAIDHAGTLLAFCHDRAITVFDVAESQAISRLQGHQSEGIVAFFQPRGGLLASSGWDGAVRLWDPIRGRPITTLTGGLREWESDRSRLTIARDLDLVTYRIADDDERRTIDCRTLGDRPSETLFGPARVEFSPEGRLIAMAFRPDGVRVARASDGAPLAHLPIGDCDEVAFLPDGSLLTYNDRGVCRWPLRRLSGGTWQLGPPEPLARIEQTKGYMSNGLAAAAGGRLIGASSPNLPGALLLDPDRPRKRTSVVPHYQIADVAISPDGRWVATGGRGSTLSSRQVNIWDRSSGRLLRQLDFGNARVAFSPDGRWLGVGSPGRYRFFRTGSWEPGAEAEHGAPGGFIPLTFHPGGRVVAILDGTRTLVRLLEVETGRVLASLEPPDQAMAHCVAFSPDGRYLAAAHADQRVHIWDFSLIRRRLDELSLATDLPDIFGGEAVPSFPADAAIDRIEVVGADQAGLRLLAIGQILRQGWFAFLAMFDAGLDDTVELQQRGDRWERMGHWRPAAADYRAALARWPNSSVIAYFLARCLAAGPGRGDPDEAVRLARMAMGLKPENAFYHQALGMALYRAGRFTEAAAKLESNIPRNPGLAGIGWLFLAMSRHRMGDSAAARDALTEAIRWRTTKPAIDRELAASFQSLRHEAESVLEGPPPDWPVDVFDH